MAYLHLQRKEMGPSALGDESGADGGLGGDVQFDKFKSASTRALDTWLALIELWSEKTEKADLYWKLFSFEQARRMVLFCNPYAMQEQCVSMLKEGQLLFISEEICDLLETAARQLQLEAITEQDLPFPCGVVFLEKGYRIEVDDDTSREKVSHMVPVECVTWKHLNATPLMKDGVTVEQVKQAVSTQSVVEAAKAFENLSEMHPALRYVEASSMNHGNKLLPIEFSCMKYGESYKEKETFTSNDINTGSIHPNVAFCRKWLSTLWKFMKQRIVVSSDAQPARHSRKRLERSKYKPPLLRIVHLRRAANVAHCSSTEDAKHVDWQCRWMVRGHWRKQWYRSEQRHKQIWISPYVKGPEDKPINITKTVYEVVR